MPPAPNSASSKFLTLAAVIIVVAALAVARDVLIPLAVAVLLTFLLAPLVHRIERLHIPRVPAVLLVVLFAFMLMVGIGWLISNQAADLAHKLSDYQSDIEQKARAIQGRLGRITEFAREVATSQPSGGTTAPRGSPDNPMVVTLNSAPSVEDAFRTLADALVVVAPLGQIFVVVIFLILMLIQREDLRDRLIRLVGHGRLTVTTRALDDAGTRVSKYLIAQSIINGCFGIIIAVGLVLLHVPNGPLWGLLCAILRFIPYVGVWIGAIFPIILSLVVPEGSFPARPFLTVGLFAGLELTAANAAEPLFFGASTGVSPLAILVSAVFWTWLWGGVGLVLATPLTVILAVLGKYVPQMRFLDVLLGDQPVLETFERYYQRLLAEDDEEAEQLLLEFEKSHTVLDSFTDVLLPALSLTEKDHRRGLLDDERRLFVHHAIRNHLQLLEGTPSKAADPESLRFALPRNIRINVLCIPANDEADEITSAMAALLLNLLGYTATYLTSNSLASEMLDAVENRKADVVLISALPPGAGNHARYLCKRLRARYADLRILVGLWTVRGDMKRIRRSMSSSANVQVNNRFRDALTQLNELVQPLIMQNAEGEPAPHPPATPHA